MFFTMNYLIVYFWLLGRYKIWAFEKYIFVYNPAMSLSQEIESRINIVDLVSRYVPLKKSGANYKALSPFTSEKSPSFVVSPAKNLAYCFSTHRGGGPIRFLMEIEGLEFREALKILAKEA